MASDALKELREWQRAQASRQDKALRELVADLVEALLLRGCLEQCPRVNLCDLFHD